jgi:hypothetical protein
MKKAMTTQVIVLIAAALIALFLFWIARKLLFGGGFT